MCVLLPLSAMAAEEPLDAHPAQNMFSETLDVSESLAGFGGDAARSPPGGGSTFQVDFVENALGEDSGISSSFCQLNEEPTLLWSPTTLSSNSRVCAVAPESWVAPEGNWLLPEPEVLPSRVGSGLLNLGNTCFLNAILQCFTHTVPLVQALRSSTHPIPCSRYMDEFCVICALRIHVERSLAASGQALSPLKFVKNLNHISSDFRRYQQEDAHEFMQCALDKLERCFLDFKKSNLNFEDDNLVEKVFGGRLISKLQCSSCGHASNTYEPLIDMSLEIENVDSLPSALESFTKVENIDESLKCGSCKEQVRMEKQLMLDQTPSVAAFHLKRFKTDGTLVEKIDKHISFPLELDLHPFTVNQNNNDVPLKYELYAIVVHTGSSSTSGHYFCFVRSAPNTWHKLDDSMVTEVSEDSVLSQEAYLLFYARQGTPWFSIIMESQTQFLDPIILSGSPTSVLDVGESISKSNPILLPSIDRDVAGASNECSEPQFDYYCPEEHDFLEINDTKDATHECGQFLSGSNQESVDFNCSEDVDAQMLFRNRVTLDDTAMLDGNSYIENGSLDNNNNCQEAADFSENAGFHCLTPPNSPLSDDASDKFHISSDNLKKENQGSCKRSSSNKLIGDSEERREARKYLNKYRSRRGDLLKFVAPQAMDKKRKKVDSSQCNKTSKKSSNTSVSSPLAAGISQ